MFNSYKVDNSIEYPSHTTKTVHEHRAPTDDSIRIYEEMKTKIYDEILFKGNIVSNFISYFLVVTKDSIKVMVIINGERKVIDIEPHEIPSYLITDENEFLSRVGKIVVDKVRYMIGVDVINYVFNLNNQIIPYIKGVEANMFRSDQYVYSFGNPISVQDFFDSVNNGNLTEKGTMREYLKGMVKEAIHDREFRDFLRTLV